MSNPFERVLARLTCVRQRGRAYQARCPAHHDKNPSLSISQGNDGRVLLYCHAGCTFERILQALNLTPAQLFRQAQRKHIVATYKYLDAHECLSYECVRYQPKQFAFRQPDNFGGWTWNLNGVTKIPYRLPELLAAREQGETIVVVEGEKDVETLQALWIAATTLPCGLRWHDHYQQYFEGANVVVLPDNDAPGLEAATQVLRQLESVACTLKLVKLEGVVEGGDVSAWLGQGHTGNELKDLIYIDGAKDPVVLALISDGSMPPRGLEFLEFLSQAVIERDWWVRLTMLSVEEQFLAARIGDRALCYASSQDGIPAVSKHLMNIEEVPQALNHCKLFNNTLNYDQRLQLACRYHQVNGTNNNTATLVLTHLERHHPAQLLTQALDAPVLNLAMIPVRNWWRALQQHVENA